ncbi:hypothetical protein KEF85_06980 [Methylomonas paludis]|uniref:Uncharacterized protein n=1 Tax=Methylomonas paludis TaxID=1173101 RepID=A0A975RBE0_9GAMM|nr:hypothetical protein [Methylomonas paludis]QWF72186.1 hypothetical protein KEF85_06980 [Methylomonas paludis]
MHALIAGFIFIMALPMICQAEAPISGRSGLTAVVPGNKAPAMAQSNAPDAFPPGSHSRTISQEANTDSVDTQSEAYKTCLRATQQFEQQEKANKTGKTALVPLSASCKTELKPVAYWQCMEKEALAKVDFNAAHSRCGK